MASLILRLVNFAMTLGTLLLELGSTGANRWEMLMSFSEIVIPVCLAYWMTRLSVDSPSLYAIPWNSRQSLRLYCSNKLIWWVSWSVWCWSCWTCSDRSAFYFWSSPTCPSDSCNPFFMSIFVGQKIAEIFLSLVIPWELLLFYYHFTLFC